MLFFSGIRSRAREGLGSHAPRNEGSLTRVVLRLFAPLTFFLIGVGISSSAFAYYQQDGRVTASTTAEGTAVTINGHAFHPPDGACYLFGNLLYDIASKRQVEVGLVRCKGAITVDGTCSDLHGFAERYDGANYYCNQGGTFALDTGYNSIVSRNSGSTIGGNIVGTSISQSGFSTTDSVSAYAWGEATGTVKGCSAGEILGYFTNWQKLNVGSSWSIVGNTSSVFHGGNIGANCAVVSAISGGSFNVSH
jgi:hypothetical protein